MGIPFYFSYIIGNHSSILQKVTASTKINNLFIDANSVIYEAAATYDTVDEIIGYVITKLMTLMEDFHPSHLVYIAFDGVAPVAKLEQQRGRRFKRRYELPPEVPRQFNTIEITPGTDFMQRLNNRLFSHFEMMEKVVYTGCMDVGEGEHKIMNYMRENAHKLSEDTNVIYGLDADLIMLALYISPMFPKLFLARETPHFISFVNRSLEPNALYMLNINELSVQIKSETKGSSLDYIFACFLLGNDFLPHFPAINIRTGGVTKIIDTFVAVTHLIDPITHTIDWVQFKQYILSLAMNERTFIINELNLRNNTQRNHYPSKTREELQLKLNMLPTYERELEKSIHPIDPGWEVRYYSALFDIRPKQVTPTFIRRVCIEYLTGLEWTFKYYGGICPDWRWTYPFMYPPLLSDLVNYIPEVSTFHFIPPSKYADTVAINQLTQLCYVLPKEYFYLLPPALSSVLSSTYNRWYINIDEDPTFIWAFCKYFWESHVMLPHIDVTELEHVVKRVTEFG